jgi:hypothetical protein
MIGAVRLSSHELPRVNGPTAGRAVTRTSWTRFTDLVLIKPGALLERTHGIAVTSNSGFSRISESTFSLWGPLREPSIFGEFLSASLA